MAKFESYQQGTPSWIEHSSHDQEASKKFYGELFAWDYNDTPMNDDGGNSVGVYSTASIEGDEVAGLGPIMAPGQPASWGVYLAADDVDAVVDKARQAGAQVHVEPSDIPGQGRIAWVQDPGGASVGLWAKDPSAGAVRANEPGTNIWNELITADFDQVAPFYEQALGMGRSSAPMGEDAGDYHMLTVDGREVAGAMPPPAEGVPPHWNVYFNVADVDASVARAKELGGQEVAPVVDMAGTGRMAFLQDPQGAAFNLMGPIPGEQQQ